MTMEINRRKFIGQSITGVGIILSHNKLNFLNQRDLPKVLIIGDSISIGYLPFVKEYLAGKAEVTRPYKENGEAENCQGTTNGLQNIDKWIGDTKWDLIHFNFGLHDIKHVDPETAKNSKNPNDPHQSSPRQYKKNLKYIVKTLKATGAKLIFATTTPYPDDVKGPLRKAGMPKVYNDIALKIMKKNNVLVNDLHAFVLPQMAELQRPVNVHFHEEGSKALGKQVANIIQEQISKDKSY